MLVLKEVCDVRSFFGIICEDKFVEMEMFRVWFCLIMDILRFNKWFIDLKEFVDLFKMVVKEFFCFF